MEDSPFERYKGNFGISYMVDNEAWIKMFIVEAD